jgi:hypothetical protein
MYEPKHEVMKKNILLLTMLTASLCIAAQTSRVQTIAELRSLPDNTDVELSVAEPDTLFATTDGRLCLADGQKILIEGMPDAKAGMMVVGTIAGMKTAVGSYPALVVDGQHSKYELIGEELSWIVFDLDAYEQALQEEPNPYTEPDIPQDDVKGIQTVTGIREFRRLPVGTEARLQFTRDTVLFISGSDAVVRGDAAICFRDVSIGLREGMVLRGTVIGVRGDDNGMPLLLPSKNTSGRYYIYDEVTFYTDHFFTFDDDDDQYVGDVVTIDDGEIDSLALEGSSQRRLCVSKDGRHFPIVDKYGVSKSALQLPARCSNMKAILSVNADAMFVVPIQDVALTSVPTGISTVNGRSDVIGRPLLDLQGRRLLHRPSCGMYIQDGRKVVVK